MGMFDYINFEMDCPKCGARVKDFQSKDSNCFLDRIDPGHVDKFYGDCPKCENWIEFARGIPTSKPRPKPFTLDEVIDMGFEMTEE